jgi:C4-dicarboxylate-specific signal transduction histidine kinase
MVTGGWLADGVLAAAALVLAFAQGEEAASRNVYLLFIPMVWSAARRGLTGAAVMAFLLQAGVIAAVQILGLVTVTVIDLQQLIAVLALVGFFIGVMADEQQRAAVALKQTLHLAAAGKIAATLTHELNQPMAALTAYGNACEYLLATGQTGVQLQQAIGRMVAEAHRAANVVRGLRDFFRTGATHLEPLGLAQLIEESCAPFMARAAARGIQLNLVPFSPLLIWADRVQLEIVLRNLIGNALDAVEGSNSTLPQQKWVEISARRLSHQKRVVVTVANAGVGLAADQLESIFEPFVSGKSGGLGLGLAISRAMIEAHGGKIWADLNLAQSATQLSFELDADERNHE